MLAYNNAPLLSRKIATHRRPRVARRFLGWPAGRGANGVPRVLGEEGGAKMEACRRCIACISRTEFPRLWLRTVGKRRTAFLSRSIFAAHNFALDKNRSNPAACRSMMFIRRNRIVRDREAHGTKTVPWLAAERAGMRLDGGYGVYPLDRCVPPEVV
jgi:hypothetical protein